ncbi:hypothetical protein KQI84_16405 [bacterium]|nr:hypothetical protein [bacterium]
MARKWDHLSKAVASTALLALLGVSSASADIDLTLDFAPGSSAADLQVPNNQFTVRLSATGTDLGTYPIIAYDLRLDFDPAQVDLVDAIQANGANPDFPFDPDINTSPTLAIPDYFNGYNRHVSAWDEAGTISDGISPVPSTYALVDLVFQTSPSPTGTFDITLGPNSRENKDPNPVLMMQDGPDTPLEIMDDGSGDLVYTVNYNSLTGLVGMDDFDGDGVADALATEVLANDPGAGNTNGYLTDSDGDGVSDAIELNYDMTFANAWNYSYDAGTDLDPRDNDTDNDGWLDGLEILYPGTFPNGPLVADNGLTDADGDGVPVGLDPDDSTNDTDLDGRHDAYELAQGYDADNINDFPPLGEINGSAPTNNLDGFILYYYAVGNIPFTNVEAHIMDADINLDGTINNLDGFILYYWAVGNIAVIPTL